MCWPSEAEQMAPKSNSGTQINCEDSYQKHVPQAVELYESNTAVVKPISVVRRLQKDLADRGVQMRRDQHGYKARPMRNSWPDGTKLNYSHLFNCTGLQADRVAQSFWESAITTPLSAFQKGSTGNSTANCPIQPRTNLYPVPDLNVPFLGVHFTPSADSTASREHWPYSHACLWQGELQGYCKP